MTLTFDTPLEKFWEMVWARACASDRQQHITATKDFSDDMTIISRDVLKDEPEKTDNITLVAHLKIHPEYTIRDYKPYLDGIIDWKILFVLKEMGEELDRELRSYFLSLLKNPIDAAHVYIDSSYLDDIDDTELLLKFKDKLPLLENELKDDIVREKDK